MKPHWEGSVSAAENARKWLPRLAAAYFAEGRKVVGSAEVPARDLHHFRLSGKRLRYTLELFSGCYGPGLGERLAELRALQGLLGEMSDCARTRELLGDGGLGLAKFLDERERARAEAFRKMWTESFDAPGREARWVRYLERYARRG